MLYELQQIFHSIIKSLEVLYVIEGVKPCARILVFEDDLEKIIDFLMKNQLFFSLSDFKVLKQTIQSEFYSDKSIKIQKNALQKGHFFVYLSKTKNFAEKAKFLEENNEHKDLGLLLGYPECCCDFFVDNFDEKNTDLTLKILNNSDGLEFAFHTNIAARHFDVALLSHFPHRFDCKPSIEIAKNNLEAIKEYSKPLAAMFLGVLQSIVVYTIGEGVFLLRKCEKIGNEFIYGDILATEKSKLYFLISSNKRFGIINKTKFVVGDMIIDGPQYGVMLFT
ncbi:hypothetical protein HYY70_00925 [Candidatus Woesearchaeota archaeon]|nr:hypothetical protein [Candidatus Woesearchaeota archaeon]